MLENLCFECGVTRSRHDQIEHHEFKEELSVNEFGTLVFTTMVSKKERELIAMEYEAARIAGRVPVLPCGVVWYPPGEATIPKTVVELERDRTGEGAMFATMFVVGIAVGAGVALMLLM